MLLHTLNTTPDSPAFNDCLRSVAAGDGLLLLGEGVYALLPGAAMERLLSCGAELFVLESDARAAGVPLDDKTLRAVDMSGFVALTEQYPRQLAWY